MPIFLVEVGEKIAELADKIDSGALGKYTLLLCGCIIVIIILKIPGAYFRR